MLLFKYFRRQINPVCHGHSGSGRLVTQMGSSPSAHSGFFARTSGVFIYTPPVLPCKLDPLFSEPYMWVNRKDEAICSETVTLGWSEADFDFANFAGILQPPGLDGLVS